ncbi:dihydrodipicolinate synthase family protein [Thermoplasma sp.]|uniref:dihydrodipicolinate synthase family protein n=1 Tax=Thermoplasma sp. TaxID=1973142 RepID=UPI00128ACF39|nr:dihydrodipicolinate synthase family protein [Thermoplasma sp.]KAA8923510.1 MAG: dihydrodipicolinate synthase [Thermoplasma sp.]
MPFKVVPVLTPFKGKEIDGDKFKDHCRRLLEDGIDMIFIAGTNGMGPTLSFQERKKLAEYCSDIPDRVIFQVGSLNLEESIELAKIARAMGFYAAAAIPPYYFGGIPEEWIVRYYTEISGIMDTFIYNYPKFTGYDVNADIAKKIRKRGGNIVGVKDTVNDIDHMLRYKYVLDDFLVFSGPSNYVLYAALNGLDGAVAAAGNYATEMFVQILDDTARYGRTNQIIIDEIIDAASRYGQWASNYSLVRILRGYDAGDPRPPFYALDLESEEKLRTEINAILRRYGKYPTR